MSDGRRVLVATEGSRLPATALAHGGELAGGGGTVVLASVLVVPRSQPLEASLDRSVASACDMLDEAERAMAAAAASFDTRLVRGRSFAEGVLATLAAEPFDIVLIEKGAGAPRDGAAQIQAVFEKAGPAVALIRPARPPG